MVTNTDFARNTCRNSRDNPNSSKISRKSRNKPSKGYNKNITFFYWIFLKDRICHILSSRVDSSEQFLFDSDVSAAIVDNSANVNIFSAEDMYTEKIDPMIYNGVEAIDGKYLIPKGIGTVRWF